MGAVGAVETYWYICGKSSDIVSTNSLSAGKILAESGAIGGPNLKPWKNGTGSLVSPAESIINARKSNDSLSGEKPKPTASGPSAGSMNIEYCIDDKAALTTSAWLGSLGASGVAVDSGGGIDWSNWAAFSSSLNSPSAPASGFCGVSAF